MALTQIEIQNIQNAKKNIDEYRKITHVLNQYIVIIQEKCDHNFTQSGPLQQCTICGLTEKK